MEDVRYDIGAVMQAAFGVNLPLYMPYPIIEKRASGIDYQSVQYVDADKAKQKSVFGTPVLFPVTFKAGTYKVFDVQGNLKDKSYKAYTLPAATLIDFSRSKNIVKTTVLGGHGTVKEIFGRDDWQIRMRGVCLATDTETTAEQQERLLKWSEIMGSIGVEGDLFVDKDVLAITIESIDFKQLQGKPGVVPFEISATSDRAIELILRGEL